MRVVSVSVLLSVFHISFLNAGKLYYPYPPVTDDVQPQYIPSSDIYSPSDETVYPTWEYLQWAPVESIPWSFGDDSSYYHYPNHKHIGSTIPCPKKGHTTKKPYIAPSTTTTTTPRPTPHIIHAVKVNHHKVDTKGSAVGIKSNIKEIELKLNQLKLALSKLARLEGLDNDFEDDIRSLPVSSETNEDSDLGEKEAVIELQSKPEMQITQDVEQDGAKVQEEDNFKADINEELDDIHLLEETTEQIMDNTSTQQEADAEEQDTEIHMLSEHREDVSTENVFPWFYGLNQDLLRDLPLDDRYFQNSYNAETSSYNDRIN